MGTAFKRCTMDSATRERLSALSRGDTPTTCRSSTARIKRIGSRSRRSSIGDGRWRRDTQKLAFAGREARGLGFDAARPRASRRRSRRSREVDSLEMRFLSGAPPAPAPAPAAARIYR